jgi:hypothetical protein
MFLTKTKQKYISDHLSKVQYTKNTINIKIILKWSFVIPCSVRVPYGTPTRKSMDFVYLIIGLGLGLELGLGLLLGLGLGNYAIFGWGCHKELFPMAPFAKDEEEESIWLKWEWLEIVAKLSDFPELVDPIMIS